MKLPRAAELACDMAETTLYAGPREFTRYGRQDSPEGKQCSIDVPTHHTDSRHERVHDVLPKLESAFGANLTTRMGQPVHACDTFSTGTTTESVDETLAVEKQRCSDSAAAKNTTDAGN